MTKPTVGGKEIQRFHNSMSHPIKVSMSHTFDFFNSNSEFWGKMPSKNKKKEKNLKT